MKYLISLDLIQCQTTMGNGWIFQLKTLPFATRGFPIFLLLLCKRWYFRCWPGRSLFQFDPNTALNNLVAVGKLQPITDKKWSTYLVRFLPPSWQAPYTDNIKPGSWIYSLAFSHCFSRSFWDWSENNLCKYNGQDGRKITREKCCLDRRGSLTLTFSSTYKLRRLKLGKSFQIMYKM